MGVDTEDRKSENKRYKDQRDMGCSSERNQVAKGKPRWLGCLHVLFIFNLYSFSFLTVFVFRVA